MPGFYATDLAPVGTASVADTGGTYPTAPIELTGYVAGSLVSTTTPDTDNFIQGTAGLTGLSSKTANTGMSIAYGRGSTLAIAGGNCLNLWVMYALPSALDVIGGASGAGVQIAVGTAVGSFSTYRVDGRDVSPYGGWRNYIIDLRNANTGPNSGGSTGVTTPTNSYFGATWWQQAAFKTAVPMAIDAIRYGRQTLSATQGTSTTVNHVTPLTSTAANFPQMAYYNDYNAGGTPQLSATNIGTAVDGGYHRFGSLQAVPGGYLARGILSLGTAAASVYFNDANRNINFEDMFLTYNDFNRIEIRNASSTVILNSINFSFIPRDSSVIIGSYAPATPKGNFEMFNNALVQITGCTFTDMGTFTFLAGASGSYTNTSTFRRCGQVKPAGMAMTSNLYINSTDTTGQILITSASEMSVLSKNTFETSQTAAPTIDLIRITGTYSADSGNPTVFTFDGHTFTSANGFGTTPGIYAVNLAGTGHIRISPTNGCNITQSMVRVTGGGSVTVVPEQKTFTISNIQPNTEIRVFKSSDSTELFGIESVGTVGSGPASGTNCTATDDSVNTGRRKVTYTHASTDAIFIVAISYDYQFLRQNYTLSNTTNQEFLLSQIIDRNYDNPA